MGYQKILSKSKMLIYRSNRKIRKTINHFKTTIKSIDFKLLLNSGDAKKLNIHKYVIANKNILK